MSNSPKKPKPKPAPAKPEPKPRRKIKTLKQTLKARIKKTIPRTQPRPASPVPRTRSHPPGNKTSIGASLRKIMMEERCIDLHVKGHTYRQIITILHEEYDLEKPLAKGTISDWCNEAMREARANKIIDVGDHLVLLVQRMDLLASKLFGLLDDRLHVVRKRVVNGFTVREVDEEPMKEILGVCAEIRKLSDSKATYLGIKHQAKPDEALPDTPQEMRRYITDTITLHIQQHASAPLPTEKMATVLELESGDPIIDSMHVRPNGSNGH